RGVDGVRLVFVALGVVDGGVGRGVDHDVDVAHRACDGCRIGDVEFGATQRPHLAAREHELQIVPEHPAGAGDEVAGHAWPDARYFASVASFCGAHQASLSRYHAIVAASPASKSAKLGVQPSSVRSFEESIA